MIALIDGDLLVHQYTSPKEIDTPTKGSDGTYHFPFNRTVKAIGEKIENIRREAECENVVVCFSHAENFRKEILPTYKGHRKNRKPIMFADCVAWVKKKFECRVVDKLEADDVMGILSTRMPGEFIICSFDKDLLTVPGLSYNWRDEFAGINEATELDGFIMWVTQTLTGDATDGYPGVKGVGPKGAAKIIASEEFAEDWWGTVVKAFGGDEDAAIVNARCAKILHVTDYDFQKKEPILWEAPKTSPSTPTSPT